MISLITLILLSITESRIFFLKKKYISSIKRLPNKEGEWYTDYKDYITLWTKDELNHIHKLFTMRRIYFIFNCSIITAYFIYLFLLTC